MSSPRAAAISQATPASQASPAAPEASGWRRAGRSRPSGAALALFFVASVLGAGFGQGLVLIPDVSITWWPPVGILIALLLLDPRATWPWWIAASALAEIAGNVLWFHNPLPLALVYTLGNALEALVAAMLIRRYAGPAFGLSTPREFGAFVVLAAGLAPMVSATVIAGTDAWIGKHDFATAWPLVWLGDATGLLVSMPLTFVAVQGWRRRARIARPRQLEVLLLSVALLVAAALFILGLLPTVYVLLPLLLWASARFQLQGAAVSLGFVAVVIALATPQGAGLLSGVPPARSGTVLLQAFLGISALCSLLVAAISLEHLRVLKELTRLNAELEERVAERTATVRESQANLRRFLDTASTGLARKGRDLRYISVNAAYARIVGVPAREIVGHTIAEVLGEPAVAKIRPWIERVLDGERVEFETDLPILHRGTRWLHIVYEPDRNEAGQIVGWVVSTADITERKAAEDELYQTTQRMQLAAEATGVGIWEWDPTTGRIRWTAQMFRIYGMPPTPDGFVNYDFWRTLVLPEDLPQQEATLGRTVRQAGRSTREFRIRRRSDGEVRTIRSVETARTDAAGKVRFVTGTSLDVTGAREAEAALKEADHRKDVFLATLSHELRNPLAPMKNALELIRRARGNSALIEQSRAIMERQMRQLERLIDDLLDVGRITHGKLELRPAPVDLALLLQQALEATQPHAACAGHQVQVTLPAEPIPLRGDAVRLTQVFANLLTNACKYTDAPGRIRLEARREGDEAVVTVADDGIGIAPEMLGRVFEMFTQATDSPGRSGGGLGIGLSIVRYIVEMHGGRVLAESPGRGRGSTFTVRLPVARPGAEAPPPSSTGFEDTELPETAADEDDATIAAATNGHAAAVAPPAGAANVVPREGAATATASPQRSAAPDATAAPRAPSGKASPAVPQSNAAAAAPPRRVLVVDDNLDSARTLADLLRMGGHETRLAHDGLAAVETAQAFRPDVILLDIGLPRQDGHAACRAIRDQPWSDRTLIVAVTGWGQLEDRRRSSAAGFDAHLVKPVDLDALQGLLAADRRSHRNGGDRG